MFWGRGTCRFFKVTFSGWIRMDVSVDIHSFFGGFFFPHLFLFLFFLFFLFVYFYILAKEILFSNLMQFAYWHDCYVFFYKKQNKTKQANKKGIKSRKKVEMQFVVVKICKNLLCVRKSFYPLHLWIQSIEKYSRFRKLDKRDELNFIFELFISSSLRTCFHKYIFNLWIAFCACLHGRQMCHNGSQH